MSSLQAAYSNRISWLLHLSRMLEKTTNLIGVNSLRKQSMKFMMVLDKRYFKELERRADHLGITVQEMYRAIITPFYLDLHPKKVKKLKEITK